MINKGLTKTTWHKFVKKILTSSKKDYKKCEDFDSEKEVYKAMDIANYIVYKCNQEKIFINNLKLNKLLYFIQKEYLKKYDRVLFIEDLLPYIYGASVKGVYKVFKYYGRGNIEEPVDKLVEIKEYDKEVIDKVILKYKDYDPMEMVTLSKKETSYIMAVETKSDIIKTEWIKNS